MRILVADRNLWLLESIRSTFADRFTVQTASTRTRCVALLKRSNFDLVIVSEKLADGSGLPLLERIAQHAPDTLRVFAATRSRLGLLRSRLAPQGLFGTLSYPIDARELQYTFALARATRVARLNISAPSTSSGARNQRRAKKLVPKLTSVRKSQPSELPAAKRLPPGARERWRAPPGSPPIMSPSSLPTNAPQATRHQRATLLLGGTTVAAFLLTLLILGQFAPAKQPLSTQGDLVAKVSDDDAVHRLIERPASFPPPRNLQPTRLERSVTPQRGSAAVVPSIPVSAGPDVAGSEPQMVASNTPIADPSTFGSEAAEPIYETN